MFKYYVLNYDFNRRKVEMFNIFQNWILDEAAQKEVKKYIRSPSKYKSWHDDSISGFEAFKKEILSLIKWQEWSRREYEISVGDAFEEDIAKLEKWDCYDQCVPNIDMICHEIIRQYKEYKKNERIQRKFYYQISKMDWIN